MCIHSDINEYFFCADGDKMICLFCGAKLFYKSFNAKRHFQDKHQDSVDYLSDEEKVLNLPNLKKKNLNGVILTLVSIKLKLPSSSAKI